MRYIYIIIIFTPLTLLNSQTETFEGTIYYVKTIESDFLESKEVLGIYQANFKYPYYIVNVEHTKDDSMQFFTMLFKFSKNKSTEIAHSNNYNTPSIVEESADNDTVSLQERNSESILIQDPIWETDFNNTETCDIQGFKCFKLDMHTTHSNEPSITEYREVYLADNLFFPLDHENYDNILSVHYKGKIPLKISIDINMRGASVVTEYSAIAIFRKKLPIKIFNPLSNKGLE